jgi:hypothetical protein
MIKFLDLFFEKKLIAQYISIGKDLGDAVSYSYMGEISGFKNLKKKFIKLQDKIISKGYTPYTLQDFVEAGGYGKNLPPLHKDYSAQSLIIKKNNLDGLGYSEEIQKSPNSILNQLGA